MVDEAITARINFDDADFPLVLGLFERKGKSNILDAGADDVTAAISLGTNL